MVVLACFAKTFELCFIDPAFLRPEAPTRGALILAAMFLFKAVFLKAIFEEATFDAKDFAAVAPELVPTLGLALVSPLPVIESPLPPAAIPLPAVETPLPTALATPLNKLPNPIGIPVTEE